MAGTFPTAGFTATELKSNTNSRLTESINGKTQRLKIGAQYFSLKLKSPPLTRSAFNEIYSFIIQQDGQVESFTLTPPEISSTTGTMTGVITTANVTSDDPAMSQSAGSTAVGVTDDGTPSGTLKKGDLIKFSNHDKVYMLTENLTLANDSAVKQMSFHPPLTTSISGGSTTVTYNSVPFKVFFTTDELSYEVQSDGLYRYEISVREEI